MTLSLEILYLYSAFVFIPMDDFKWKQDYCYFILCWESDYSCHSSLSWNYSCLLFLTLLKWSWCYKDKADSGNIFLNISTELVSNFGGILNVLEFNDVLTKILPVTPSYFFRNNSTKSATPIVATCKA